MDERLQDLGEDGLVSQLISCLPSTTRLRQSPGDDCAVAPRDEKWDSLLKTDVIVENIHFLSGEDPERIGRKALARALSDMAAMGGIPEYALITLLADPSQPLKKIKGIYNGLADYAVKFDVEIAGGETSALPHPGLAINVAMTGRVEKERALLRSSAQAGDAILVTGVLGGSLSGHHLDFTPRLDEGRFLLSSGKVHAMMDLSDGLAKDLPRLASASHLEYQLHPETIPLREGCTLHQGLTDGEDYELLMTVPSEQAGDLMGEWSRYFSHTPMTVIGKMVLAGEGSRSLLSGGWEHFSL